MRDMRGIFKVYNVLKKHPKVEQSRLRKALSLAMRKVAEDKYFTTLMSCTCPDQSHRSQVICKHRIAYMMRHPSETAVALFEDKL